VSYREIAPPPSDKTAALILICSVIERHAGRLEELLAEPARHRELMRTLEILRKMRNAECGMRNGEEEKADGKCQMADGKCQMADDGCRTGDDGVASGECRVASEERVASGQWSVASESGESGKPMQEEGRSPQNVQNEANLESTQSSLLLEVESSTTEPAGQKRSQFTQAVASEDGVASGDWRVASEIGRTVNPTKIRNPKSKIARGVPGTAKCARRSQSGINARFISAWG